jgi:hypothetical protein
MGENNFEWEKRVKLLSRNLSIQKLCGGIAEEKYLKRPNPDGMRSDIELVKIGITLMVFSKLLDENEAETYYDNLVNFAKQLMKDPNNWQAVEYLANALLENEGLTGPEAWKIIDGVLNRPK